MLTITFCHCNIFTNGKAFITTIIHCLKDFRKNNIGK